MNLLLLRIAGCLLIAGSICGTVLAEEGPTLHGVRVAVLVSERAQLGSVSKFKQSLNRAGWLAEPFVAVDVAEFRAAHADFPLVVEGTFGDEMRAPTIMLHWEKNKSQGFPSTSDTMVTFDDVVAEFIEFVQQPYVQHYLFDQRRGRQSNPYQTLLDEAWNKTNSAQWALAIADVENALKMPDAKGDTHPLFLLGYCYKELGRFDKAVEAFKSVLVIQTDHSGALLDLGNLAFDLGDYDEAKLRYQQVVDLKTSNIHRANWNLGLLNQIKQNWQMALDNFRSLKNKPNYSEAAGRRIAEIEKRMEEIRQRDEAEKLARERLATFYSRLRGSLAAGVLLVGTAWLVVQHRLRQKDPNTPPDKRDALPNLINNGLVGIWGGLITALVMSFVGK